jgi:hypothetical protein
MCADPGGDPLAGSPVVLRECNQTAPQLWVKSDPQSLSEGLVKGTSWHLRNGKNFGLCLTAGSDNEDDGHVHVDICGGGAFTQSWLDSSEPHSFSFG